MIIVRMVDLRACGFCVETKQVFFERHGLDWRKFVKEGITAEELEPYSHLHNVKKALQAAEERMKCQNQAES